MVRKTNEELDRSEATIVSRRDLLLTGSATALAVGLAGCGSTSNSGDDGGNGNGGDGGSGGGPKDTSFTTFTNADPKTSHYNYYNPAQYGGADDYLYNLLWRYNWRTGKYHDRIGTNYKVNGKTATFEVNTNYKWADGKPVTATDIKKQLTLEKYIGESIWDFINGVQTKGDSTVRLQLKTAYNPKVFRAVLGQDRYIVVKRGSEYDTKWLSKFKNAGSESERKSIKEKFLTWQYAKDSDDPVANGPYKIGSVDSGKWTLEKNENFPYETNISQYVLSASESDQDNWQKAISNKLDGWGILALPTNIKKQLPDNLKKITLGPVSIYAPMFNFDTIWGKRELRQALAYLLDRELVIKNVNPRQKLAPKTTGLTSNLANRYLGKSFVDQQLTDYGVKSKPEKAAKMMRKAGFKKQDGSWVDGSGDPIMLRWVGPSFPGSIGFGETLTQILPKFGIESQNTILAPSQWITRRSKSDFDLTFDNLAGPHPYFYLYAVIASDRSKYGNHPRETVQLPPVGKSSGKAQKLNIAGVFQDIAKANNEKQLKQATQKYAWYFNQELPNLHVAESMFPTYISTDDWQVPPLDSDVMGVLAPLHQLLRETEEGSNRALIQGKTK